MDENSAADEPCQRFMGRGDGLSQILIQVPGSPMLLAQPRREESGGFTAHWVRTARRRVKIGEQGFGPVPVVEARMLASLVSDHESQ